MKVVLDENFWDEKKRHFHPNLHESAPNRVGVQVCSGVFRCVQVCSGVFRCVQVVEYTFIQTRIQ